MRQVCAVVLMLFATSSFAGNKGIKCEAESHSERDDTLVVICPPPFAFSPIRVQMMLGQIDRFGWEHVDLKEPMPVRVVQDGTSHAVAVRLPLEKDGRHWLAWRKFGEIRKLVFWEEENVAAYQEKGN
jgi:hypothetical protein